MSAETSTTTTTRIIRNEGGGTSRSGGGGSEPYSRKKDSDLTLIIGSLVGGAVAGYFITDYISKIDILGSIGLGAPEPQPQAQANLTYYTPLWPEQSGEEWDRQTRQTTNNYNAYLAQRQLNTRGPPTPVYVEEEAINQIVTDDAVYDNI